MANKSRVNKKKNNENNSGERRHIANVEGDNAYYAGFTKSIVIKAWCTVHTINNFKT